MCKCVYFQDVFFHIIRNTNPQNSDNALIAILARTIIKYKQPFHIYIKNPGVDPIS